MRYRLTVISVIVAVIALAAVLVTLSNEDTPPAEPERTPTPVLGIVAAFTATARAGGAALDPTAFATPTILVELQTPTPSVVAATFVPGYQPQVRTTSGPVSPGQSISIEITGAAPGEQFGIVIGGKAAGDANSTDATGSAAVNIAVPVDLQDGNTEIVFTGAQSGTASTSIEVSSQAPLVTISPGSPVSGEAVTITADGLGPAQMVTIRISGSAIGSAVTDDNGSFSITTRLPELGEGAHEVSLDGQDGQLASAEVNVGAEPAVAQPTATVASQARPNSGSGVPVPTGTAASTPQEQDTGVPGAGETPEPQTGPELPPWLYVVIGVFAGWLGLLTIWVVRLDRSRERRSEALLRKMANLVFNARGQAKPANDPEAGEREQAT